MMDEKKLEKSNEKKASQTTSTSLDDLIPMKDIPQIEDGKHIGEIIRIERALRGDDEFDYTEAYIRIDGGSGEIKTSFPTKLSDRSTFGKFLKKSGFELKPGNDASFRDISKHLIGKKVEFQTYTNDNGWPDIIKDTVKFLV